MASGGKKYVKPEIIDFTSPAIPDNSKFPHVYFGIRNLREGKERY